MLRSRFLVVDEDYQGCGLSGECAAKVLENNISMTYARVCTQHTIPHNRTQVDQTLPNVDRIISAVKNLL
jgi:pyruvate/2-oxoglutarate/acetoin dehydrogenase E1 component